MTEHVECIVIGAGVIGLAVARACALAGRETVVVEAEAAIGTGISSRNSEVLHAGIYYAPGSLKARLCVAGRQALTDYCDTHGVDYRRCGKLVVATCEAQRDTLHRIQTRAEANGVHDLRWLEPAAARELEPALRCTAALASPVTGIIDSHGLMLALQGDIEAAGGMLALGSPVIGGRVAHDGIALRIGAAAPMELVAGQVINCAGLQAPSIAAAIDGVPKASVPRARLAKGNYYSLTGRAPFSRLIYPVPEPGGLGVHLTLDLAQQARFGPDVEWVETPDYRVAPDRGKHFYKAVRRYWPELPDGALQPDYAGIRPKLVRAADDSPDFMIQDQREHGIAGLINLYGIDSPGLTACLALAGEVAARLDDFSR